MIRVVNKYRHEPTINDFYIGRGSPIGNPYSHRKHSQAEHIVETREEAVSLFREWFHERLNEGDETILSYLSSLIEHYKINGRLNLVCFCSPMSCHGDIVKEALETILGDDDEGKV